MTSRHVLDLITIAGYLLVTLLIGLSFAKRKETSEDHFLAGRRLMCPTLLGDSRLWGPLLAATELTCWIVFR